MNLTKKRFSFKLKKEENASTCTSMCLPDQKKKTK